MCHKTSASKKVPLVLESLHCFYLFSLGGTIRKNKHIQKGALSFEKFTLLLPTFTGDSVNRKNECIQKVHLMLKNHYFYLALLDSGNRKDERVQKGTHGVGKPKLLNY